MTPYEQQMTGSMGMNQPIQPYGGGLAQGTGTLSGSPMSSPTNQGYGASGGGGQFNGSQVQNMWGQNSGQNPAQQNWMAQLAQMYQGMNGGGGQNNSGGNWGNAAMPPWMQQGGFYPQQGMFGGGMQGAPMQSLASGQYQMPGNGGQIQPLGVSKPPGGQNPNYAPQSAFGSQNNYSQSG